MQPKTTPLIFALLTLVAAAAACDATPAESFRDFEDGTGGESGSDTGGLDIICVSDEDGVTAEREYGEGCPMDYTLGCVASEYPDPTSGAACCLIGSESDCFMNWGESTCPGSHVLVCGAEALGSGDGDGDGDPMLVCGDGDYLYAEYFTGCDAGYDVVCGVGTYLNPGTRSVCCIGDSCRADWWTNGCYATESHVCDIP
jgi:hypothetical protein